MRSNDKEGRFRKPKVIKTIGTWWALKEGEGPRGSLRF